MLMWANKSKKSWRLWLSACSAAGSRTQNTSPGLFGIARLPAPCFWMHFESQCPLAYPEDLAWRPTNGLWEFLLELCNREIEACWKVLLQYLSHLWGIWRLPGCKSSFSRNCSTLCNLQLWTRRLWCVQWPCVKQRICTYCIEILLRLQELEYMTDSRRTYHNSKIYLNCDSEDDGRCTECEISRIYKMALKRYNMYQNEVKMSWDIKGGRWGGYSQGWAMGGHKDPDLPPSPKSLEMIWTAITSSNIMVCLKNSAWR